MPTLRLSRSRATALAVLVLVASAVAAPAAAATGEPLAEARRALAEERYAAVEELLAGDPAGDTAAGRLLRGRAALLDERHAAGAEHFERAVELGADEPRTHLYLGAAYWESGRFEAAEEVYERALARAEASGGSASARLFLPLHQLGRLRLWRGRAADAVEPLERAAVLAPAAPDVALDLARALEGAGEAERALAAYRRAVALAPASTHARWGLARLLARGGDRAAAERELAIYRRLYEDEQERVRAEGLERARLDRGRRLLAAGDAGAAAAAFRELGESPDALAGLGRALVAAGEREAGAAALERAVALAPDRRDLRRLLAELRMSREPDR